MKIDLEFDDIRAAKLVRKICYRAGMVVLGILVLYIIFAIFRFSFLLATAVALVTAFFLAMLWVEYVLGGHVNPYSSKNTRTKGDPTIVTFGAGMVGIIWLVTIIIVPMILFG